MSKVLKPGCYVAVVTPFMDDGSVDWTAFDGLIDRLAQAGVEGLVLLGTTAEVIAVEADDQLKMIARAIDIVSGSCALIAGTGSNNSAETARWNARVGELNIDATMVVTPYYNRPNPEGLLKHFSLISSNASKPFILYDHPKRTGTALSLALLEELADNPSIIGVKDAQSNLAHSQGLLLQRPDHWSLFSGDDYCGLAQTRMGYDGVISVIANACPKYMGYALSHLLENRGWPRHAALFLRACESLNCDVNPIPIKWLLHRLGHMEPTMCLPMVPLAPEHHQLVDRMLPWVEKLETIAASVAEV